ncbi:MAG TPA: hypothetical protein PK416_07860, partial [Thermodesulfobacteriota bacterium]|nr:hypothetical protein [Thermodesulfobacteriota bacterium]
MIREKLVRQGMKAQIEEPEYILRATVATVDAHRDSLSRRVPSSNFLICRMQVSRTLPFPFQDRVHSTTIWIASETDHSGVQPS